MSATCAAGSPSRTQGPDSAQLQPAANGGANGAVPSRSRRHSRTSARRHGVPPAQLGSSTTPRQGVDMSLRDAVKCDRTGYIWPGRGTTTQTSRHHAARRDSGASYNYSISIWEICSAGIKSADLYGWFVVEKNTVPRLICTD